MPDTEHTFRVRAARGNSVSEWSDAVKEKIVKAPHFSDCVWKESPDDIDEERKYSVDEKNPQIATNVSSWDSTVVGNAPLPFKVVTSWSIKILKSRDNDGGGIFIGVAPSDIDQNEHEDYGKYGWYFGCYGSKLISGPPHNYSYPGIDYGEKRRDKQYVRTGDSVGVVMDTAKGELSFVLGGVNFGVAFERIPLDKPLVPCVLLRWQGDFVELEI